MKWLLTLLLFTLITGCENTVVDEGRSNSTPPRVDPVCPAPPVSPILFAGVREFQNIEQRQLRVHWDHVIGAGSYNVYQLQDGEEPKLVRVVKAPGNKSTVKGLTPGTTYRFKVVMLDNYGLVDSNTKELEVTTSAFPTYENNKSVQLNGLSAVELAASDKLFPNKKKFSVSLWFKTSLRETSDTRLFTIHRKTNADESALAIGVEDDDLFITMRKNDASASLIRVNVPFTYYDDQWHNLVVTQNNNKLVFYINGAIAQIINEGLYSIGTYPSFIGAWSVTRKNFRGLIDEVAVWKNPLSKTDVQLLYNSGSSSDLLQHRRYNALRHWYRMGDLSADDLTTINDVLGVESAQAYGVQYSTEAP
jgi:hypothetical protein